MQALKKLIGLLTAFSLACLIVATPSTSAEVTQGAEAVTTAPQFVLVEPVIELLPGADPSDTDVQAEVEDLGEDIMAELTEGANSATTAAPGYRASAIAGGFSLYYSGDRPPASTRTVIERAVDDWAVALKTSSGPIAVELTWQNLGSNIVGSAGPNGLYRGPEGYIPAALWNTQTNSDVNGALPEVLVTLNSEVSWYVGSGTPSRTQIDLHSVMLHELAHGLGFLGLGSPTDTSFSAAYDGRVAFNGTPYLETTNPAAALVSNNLTVNTSDSSAYRVHAPSTWTPGSSLSHFDEATHGDDSPGAILTPTITSSHVHRVLDGPVLGVMAQTGWEINAPLVSPTITSVNATSNGVAVNWDGNHGQYGYIPDQYRVEVLRSNSLVASKDVAAASGVSTDLVSTTFAGLPSGNLTYRVTPIDNVGTGEEISGRASEFMASNGTTVDEVPLAAVDYVRLEGDGPTKKISWPAAEDASYEDTSYLVQKSTDGSKWSTIRSTTGTSLSHTFDTGTYQVRVITRDSARQSTPTGSIPTPIGSDFIRPAPLDHGIQRLYEATFLRYPDEAGLVGWRLEHAQRTPFSEIAESFTGSAEFDKQYGSLNNVQFVHRLYQNVLGRPADSTGLTGWLRLLNAGVPRGEILIGLSNSLEFIRTTDTAAPTSAAEGSVYRLYVAYFNRLPDQAGLESWVSQLSSGLPLAQVSENFARSTEFEQTYGSTSNRQFVELLYNNVLARESDTAGRNQWQDRLSDGQSRGSVMLGFSESAELILATGSNP